MLVDPILRFAWIFYAIFTHDTQHSTIVSFMVAFAEVSRRGMWTIFRVENEHCSNVAHYKASRDVPLPYKLEGEDSGSGSGADDGRVVVDVSGSVRGQSSGVDVQGSPAMARMPSSVKVASRTSAAEEGRAGGSTASEGGGTIKRRLTRADTIVGTLSRHMAEAHKQDFEKRRKPPVSPGEDEDEDEIYQHLESAAVAGAAAREEDDDTDDMEGGGSFSEDDTGEEELANSQSAGKEDGTDGLAAAVLDNGNKDTGK